MGFFTGSDKENETNSKDLIKKEDSVFDVSEYDKYQKELRDSLKATESSLRDVFQVSNEMASLVLDRSLGLIGDFRSFFRDDHDDEYLTDVKKLDRFLESVSGGLLSNPFNINYKPLTDKSSGYWAYPSPSSEIYEACKEKNGLSVWDEQGYWRCLFPRAIIPLDKLSKVLSKEDVLEDSTNQNGLFFQEFNKYLDWKSNMKKILRLEKLKKLEELRRQQKEPSPLTNKFDFDDIKKNEFESVNSNVINKDKKITGTKEYVSTYESNGVRTETLKRYEYYDDGSSAAREVTKKFDKDAGSTPQIEEHTEEFPAKKTGWIWDNSEDDK